MANETTVVNQIRRAIEREYPYAWIFKVVGSPQQEPGIPDLLVCVEGLLFGLEVKHQRPGESLAHARGRASLQQEAQISRLKRAGAEAAVVVSAEEALALIDSKFSSEKNV